MKEPKPLTVEQMEALVIERVMAQARRTGLERTLRDLVTQQVKEIPFHDLIKLLS